MIGLSAVVKTIGIPVKAALTEDGVVLGASDEWCNTAKQHWLDVVKNHALSTLYRNARAAFEDIERRLKEAVAAEELGVPPPDGIPSSELQARLEQGKAVFKSVYDAVMGTNSVESVNDVLRNALNDGHLWLVGQDWSEYPPEFPWRCGNA